MKITRRNFFLRTAQSTLVLAMPAVFSSLMESCASNPTGPSGSAGGLQSIQGTTSGLNVIVSVDSSSPISKTGTAALVNFSNGSVLVDHPSTNVFNALSSICTHQGCQINGYDSGSNQFVCPCHGSRFDVNGQVTQGPAGTPLQKYQTSISGTQLIIKVG